MAAGVIMAGVGLAMSLSGRGKSSRATKELIRLQKEQQAQQIAQNQIAATRQRRKEMRQARIQAEGAKATMAQSGIGESSSLEGLISGLGMGVAESSAFRSGQMSSILAGANLQTSMASAQSDISRGQQLSNFGGGLIQTGLSNSTLLQGALS